MTMTTITNLTNLYTLAAEDSITCPIEIHIDDCGAASAVYDGSADVIYASLDELLDAHTIDSDELCVWLSNNGDEPAAIAVAVNTADTNAEPDYATQYLALYTGPNGPISAEFAAMDLDDASAHAEQFGRRWYDSAANALDIDPDSDTLESDVKLAIEAGTWALAQAAANTDEYAIYVISRG